MSSYSYSSSSYSSSSTTSNGQTTGQSYATQSYSNPRGTTVQHMSQNSGEPAIQETRYYDGTGREVPADSSGRRIEGGGAGGSYGGDSYGSGSSTRGRIEDVSDNSSGSGGYRAPQANESENDRIYRERMEDEYAKREGGA